MVPLTVHQSPMNRGHPRFHLTDLSAQHLCETSAGCWQCLTSCLTPRQSYGRSRSSFPPCCLPAAGHLYSWVHGFASPQPWMASEIIARLWLWQWLLPIAMTPVTLPIHDSYDSDMIWSNCDNITESLSWHAAGILHFVNSSLSIFPHQLPLATNDHNLTTKKQDDKKKKTSAYKNKGRQTCSTIT